MKDAPSTRLTEVIYHLDQASAWALEAGERKLASRIGVVQMAAIRMRVRAGRKRGRR